MYQKLYARVCLDRLCQHAIIWAEKQRQLILQLVEKGSMTKDQETKDLAIILSVDMTVRNTLNWWVYVQMLLVLT
jgi:hypothetical protein